MVIIKNFLNACRGPKTIFWSAIVLFFSISSEAIGCSCDFGLNDLPSHVKELKERVDIVLTGKVEVAYSSADGVINNAEILVDQIWKGQPGKRILLDSSSNFVGCGISFKQGEAYLVFATGPENGSYYTMLCMLTRPLDSELSQEIVSILELQ